MASDDLYGFLFFFPLLSPRIIQNRILVVTLAIILVITILMAITFSVRRHWCICSSLKNSNNGVLWVIKTKRSHESFFCDDRPWVTLPLSLTTVQLKCKECKNIFCSCLHVGWFPFLGLSSPRFVFYKGRQMFICLLVISSTDQNSLGDILSCPVDMLGVMVWERAWWVNHWGFWQAVLFVTHLLSPNCPAVMSEDKNAEKSRGQHKWPAPANQPCFYPGIMDRVKLPECFHCKGGYLMSLVQEIDLALSLFFYA